MIEEDTGPQASSASPLSFQEASEIIGPLRANAQMHPLESLGSSMTLMALACDSSSLLKQSELPDTIPLDSRTDAPRLERRLLRAIRNNRFLDTYFSGNPKFGSAGTVKQFVGSSKYMGFMLDLIRNEYQLYLKGKSLPGYTPTPQPDPEQYPTANDNVRVADWGRYFKQLFSVDAPIFSSGPCQAVSLGVTQSKRGKKQDPEEMKRFLVRLNAMANVARALDEAGVAADAPLAKVVFSKLMAYAVAEHMIKISIDIADRLQMHLALRANGARSEIETEGFIRERFAPERIAYWLGAATEADRQAKRIEAVALSRFTRHQQAEFRGLIFARISRFRSADRLLERTDVQHKWMNRLYEYAVNAKGEMFRGLMAEAALIAPGSIPRGTLLRSDLGSLTGSGFSKANVLAAFALGYCSESDLLEAIATIAVDGLRELRTNFESERERVLAELRAGMNLESNSADRPLFESLERQLRDVDLSILDRAKGADAEREYCAALAREREEFETAVAKSEQLAGKTISDPSEDRLLKIRKVVHNSPQRRRASPEKAERLRKRYEKAGYDPRGTHVEVEVVYLSQPKRGGGVTWISPVRLLRKLQSGEWSVEE